MVGEREVVWVGKKEEGEGCGQKAECGARKGAGRGTWCFGTRKVFGRCEWAKSAQKWRKKRRESRKKLDQSIKEPAEARETRRSPRKRRSKEGRYHTGKAVQIQSDNFLVSHFVDLLHEFHL